MVWEDNHMVSVQDNDSMIDEVEHIYIRSYLEQGLNLLEPKAKEILYLLYYEELSYHEIADIMSSSTNTV
ncbi:sigma-70 family RNA polymerase sigma factor [Patescibacteria group bacterium]|nr:sigma-70 family RNA polymerase sigma factor [Patescibacteria group bacterium]